MPSSDKLSSGIRKALFGFACFVGGAILLPTLQGIGEAIREKSPVGQSAGSVAEARIEALLSSDIGVSLSPALREDALRRLRQANAAVPNTGEACISYGDWHYQRRQYPEATYWFMRASDDPDFLLESWNGIALACAADRHELAVAVLDSIVAKSPRAEYRVNLANIIKAKDCGRAIALFKEAVTLMPGSAIVRYDAGTGMSDCGNLEDAEVELREAVKLDPLMGDAWVNLALLVQQRGDDQLALEHALRGVGLRHSPVRGWSLVAELRATGSNRDCGGAIEAALLAVGENQASAMAWNILGAVYSGCGRESEAVLQFDRALAADPTYLPATINRAVRYGSAGEPGKVIDLLRPFRDKAGRETWRVLTLLGEAHLALRNDDEALDCYEQATGTRPDECTGWYNMAAAKARLGRLKEAHVDLARAFHCDATLREPAQSDADFVTLIESLGLPDP